MNGYDFRSSQSSYGDPRHFSATSLGPPQPPPSKVLLDGYRNDLDPTQTDGSRFNPLNPAHPRSSALLNAHDPVAMYLLTETAMNDSTNYEILSLEEVEALKKENKFLSGRLDGAKRKLALEVKLRDAAQSLSRLYTSKSPRASEEYESGGSPKSHRSRKSLFGRSSGTVDKTDVELAASTRKCEELSQEVWGLERRVQTIQKRLLEHTAGVLQMTHKGLKKNPKNGIPHTPESLSSHHTHGSVDEFDDRSLYKPSENIHEPVHRKPVPNTSEPQSAPNLEIVQSMERRLEELSARMRDMILHSSPDRGVDPVPMPAQNGGPVNPMGTVEAHLAYITNGMSLLNSLPQTTPAPAPVPSETRELDTDSVQQLAEINNRLYNIVAESGLPHSQILSPPPKASNDGLAEQFSYLGSGLDGLHRRVEGLLDQKSILTTQIQQQRELNSKSDAERDAHIGELIEQLAGVRKDLEASERDGQKSRSELDLAMAQLEEARRDLTEHQSRGLSDEDSGALVSEKEARAHAESELARLQLVMQELHQEREAQAGAHEAHLKAESDIARLEAELEHARSQPTSDPEELAAIRAQAERDIARLEADLEHARSQPTSDPEELAAVRSQAEKDVALLKAELEQLRSQPTSDPEELAAVRAQAERDIARLEAELEHARSQPTSDPEELAAIRAQAERDIARLEADLEHARSQPTSDPEELATVRAQADSEIARLQEIIDQLNESGARTQEATEARERAEQQVVQLESALLQLRTESDARIKEAMDMRTQAESDVARLEASMAQHRSEVETQLREASEGRTQAEENSSRLQAELTELEGEVVRVQTELTMAKAELDGAYGSRSQRAAPSPAIQKQFEELTTRNLELTEELAALKAGNPGTGNLSKRAEMLEKELRETVDDYEAMTKASIEFEKERERFEGIIDSLRDRCEQLETQINEERITWMGVHHAPMARDGSTMETTSTMVLKNEFKKMMRDTRTENMKILKAEQEERRRLENLVRSLKKEREQANATGKPDASQPQAVTA